MSLGASVAWPIPIDDMPEGYYVLTTFLASGEQKQGDSAQS